jgi:hypothetical protein
MSFDYKSNVYWKVDSKIFSNKFDALLHATQTNKEVTFHFFDEIFEKFDKSLLGKSSLTNLYRERAQQLRDEYDYLILYFSGGADSYNILRTFLDNQIKLDEVCVKWPMAVIKKQMYEPNVHDKSAFNYLSEWDYAIVPVLDDLKKSHPEIKIEIADWSNDLSPSFFNEENFRKANAWNDVEVAYTLSTSSNDIELTDRGKRVASIYGIDKPLLAFINNNWVCCFVDASIGIGAPLDHNQNYVEYFYWTPKMPLLPLEQAHSLCSYIDNHPGIKKFFYNETYANLSQQEKDLCIQVQNDIIKTVIYDTWDFKFQANKPIRKDRTDKQFWIFSNPELESYKQSFIDMNDLFLKQLDDRFIDIEKEGYQVKGKMRGLFKFCKSKWHFVKRAEKIIR